MPAQALEQPRGGAIGERGIELVEQRLGIVEAAAVAVEAGFAQEPEGDTGFAGAGRTDEQDIFGAAQEVEAGQRVDLRFVDPRLAIEREGVERPPPRQMCLIEAVGQAALAARRRLGGEQPMEHLGGGCGVALGTFDLSVEGCGHAVEAQLGEQGLQLVTHRGRRCHRDRRSRRRPAAG
jgi:hypothetical protein